MKKKYDHNATINLHKARILYASIIDGTIISSDVLRWYKDSCTSEKFCLVKTAMLNYSINTQRFSHTLFHEQFKECVDRQQELINETKKFRSRIDGREYDISQLNNPYTNSFNPITYDLVSDPAFDATLNYLEHVNPGTSEQFIKHKGMIIKTYNPPY